MSEEQQCALEALQGLMAANAPAVMGPLGMSSRKCAKILLCAAIEVAMQSGLTKADALECVTLLDFRSGGMFHALGDLAAACALMANAHGVSVEASGNVARVRFTDANHWNEWLHR